MATEAAVLDNSPPLSTRFLRAQDVVWLLFIVTLVVTMPEPNYDAYILFPLLGAFQIVEPRLRIFSSKKGQIVSISLKLALSYLLLGFTHPQFSPYNPIFLIPIVSAAQIFELSGVVVVTLIACIAYASFLLPVFVDWNTLPPGYLGAFCARLAFYPIVAYLVYEQAKAKRDEMERTREAAERLAEANRNLRRAEASLRRSERLAALGQLTAGLAHELRNPLGTIKASAEMLTKNSTRGRPEIMAEMAGYIVSEADRVNGLISSFLDFARPLQIHPMNANLKTVIEEVVRQQAELAASREVAVFARPNPEPIEFEFDPDLLKVALSNLIQNAIQASQPSQSVEIRVDNRTEDVLLFVTDHGSGIQPEHLENIFNPFFTTKPNGVGLGLALVSKVADEHLGRVRVFSEVGKGTTFELTLPKTQTS